MLKKEEKEIPGTKLTTDGGVIKEVLVEGKGGTPQVSQEVAVTYTGVWTNGDELDKNTSVKAPYRFIVGVQQVMQGWDIVILTMKKGEKAKVTIDPKYGSGWPSCPAYFPYDAKAQYEIEILDFYNKRKPFGMWTTEELIKTAEEYKAYGKDYFLAGKLNHAVYSYYEALRFIDAIDKLLPEYLELRRTLKLNLAVCFFKQSDWKETIKICDTILKEKPELTKALYLRGTSLGKLDKVDDALLDLYLVVEATPEDTKAKSEYEKMLKIRKKQTGVKKVHKSPYSEMFDMHQLYDELPVKQKALPAYNPANPRVYIDFQIGKSEQKKIIFELFAPTAPKTVENFKCLCTGEKQSLNSKLHYIGCRVLAVIKGFALITGDVENKIDAEGVAGTTHCIYGKTFETENLSIAHSKEGVLSMYNKGPNMNASEFMITFRPCPDLDGKQVAFGRIVKGLDALKQLESISVKPDGKPNEEVFIVDCGAYPDPVTNPENC